MGETNHTGIETRCALKRLLFTVSAKQSRDEVSTLHCVAVVTLAIMSVILFHCYSTVPASPDIRFTSAAPLISFMWGYCVRQPFTPKILTVIPNLINAHWVLGDVQTHGQSLPTHVRVPKKVGNRCGDMLL